MDVSHNKIQEIDPAIFDLLQLTSLNLSHNNLSDIPKPKHEGKTHLIRLDISQNKFHQVPYSLVYFPHLSYLNLSHNRNIDCLPYWIASLEKLEDLRLEGLPLLYQHRGGFHDTLQCLKLKLDKTMQVYDMKMIVTGLSRNGKSLLINRLRNYTPSVVPTPSEGVSIVNWTYRASPEHTHSEYKFSIWETGGGMDSYEGVAIEQVLYTSHAMYILVFSLLDGVSGVNDLRVWLNAISRHALSSCVLLVGTGLEQLDKSMHDQVLDEIEKSAKGLVSNFSNVLIFGNPCFIPVSVTSETGNIQLLRDVIYELATSLVLKDGQPYMGRRVSLSTMSLNSEVNNYRHQVWKGERSPVLYQEGMKAIVASLKDAEGISTGELHTITQFLSSVGSLLHYPSISESLSTMYFLDPDWIFRKIRVFFAQLEEYSDSTSSSLKENGICTHQHLQSLLAKEFTVPTTNDNPSCKPHSWIVDSLISLLVRYKLLIPVTFDYSQFVVPSLLPSSPSREEMVSMVTDKCLPIQWNYSLNQPLDRALWLSVLESTFIMKREHMIDSDKSDSLLLRIWRDSMVLKEDGIVLSYSHEIGNITLFSLGYTPQFIELSSIIDKCLPSNVVISITCPICLQLKISKPNEFSANMCIEARINGKELLPCQYLDETANHLISMTELAPFMIIHPSHERLHSGDDTSTCTDNGVKCVHTKLSTVQVIKQLNTASIILKDFDYPFITVKQGRLLALAVHREEKEAIQVFQDPAIGSLADITQGIPRVVLYRIAIQIAKIIVSVPGISPSFENLQLWSVDPEHLLHCSLIINHAYELKSSSFTEQLLIKKWVFFVKKVTEFASTAAIKSSNGTFTPNYYYLNELMDECSKKDNTISLESVISSLSVALMQLIAGVCPLPDLSPVCGACNVLKSQNVPRGHDEDVTNSIEPPSMYNEIWIPSLNEEASHLKLNILKPGCMSLDTIEVHSLAPLKVIAICKCGESVWMSSQLSNNMSCVSIFDIHTYNIVHNIKMEGNVVTCMDSLENQVFLGTKAGFLFVFPSSVEVIRQGGVKPTHKYICKKEINSLVAMETVLWISGGNCIFLFEWKIFKFKGVLKCNMGDTTIGELVPSHDNGIVYSANFGGKILSAWSTKEKHMYDVNMEDIMLSIREKEDVFISDVFISAMNTSRDCVWVGLVTGHLLVFNLRGVLVAWLRPYNFSINYLCFVPDLIRGPSEQHILSCGRGVALPSVHGNLCESNPKEEVLLLWESEFAVTLKQMKALEENEGRYLDTYNSLNDMIKNCGFKDQILTPKKDTNVKKFIPFVENATTEIYVNEDDNEASTLWGILPFELKDGETTEIPFENVPTLEQLQLKILSILSLETTDDIQIIDISIAYRYKNQDTLVAVTSDDDLLCYLDLTERPNLLLMDHTFD